jgi:hypothetical protein
MPWRLVVEGETVAVEPNIDDATGLPQPAHRRSRRGRTQRGARRRPVGRQQRVARQRMQDVGDQQLLVLLLVVQAERDDRLDGGPQRGVGTVEQCEHGRIHMHPVGMHLVNRRARHQAALRARVTWAEGFVVRVEEVMEALIERLVAVRMHLQQHRLEKPGRVREVPLGRARIGHRLDALVFC